jgi:PAS domain S-box-containing protein
MSAEPRQEHGGSTAALAQAILGTASDAIIAADRDGVITYWNPGAERIFGHPAVEAVGRSLDLIIPERLRAAHWRGFAEVMRTGRSRYDAGELLSVPGIRRDGRRISLEFTIAPLQDEGRMAGIAAILRDVTPRFDELKALRRRLAEQGLGPADDPPAQQPPGGAEDRAGASNQ